MKSPAEEGIDAARAEARRALTDIGVVLKTLKIRRNLLQVMIDQDDGSELLRDEYNFRRGSLQALIEAIALIEGPTEEEV